MRTVANPLRRFAEPYVEWLDQPPPANLEVREETTTSEIVAENDSPDVGFRYSVNPYRGCTHACAYCMGGDTPVLMADGRGKPLADLRVGDAIIGTRRDGRYRRYVATRVLDTWTVVKPAHRVVLEDGRMLVTSAEHRFLSRRGWTHVRSNQLRGACLHLERSDVLRGVPAPDAGALGRVASGGWTVASMTPLAGTAQLHDITTGTGDFVANGVISHNCYARPSHEYLDLGAGTDFDTKIVAKVRAPELLRAKLRSKSWKFELIAFSGDTDCYQPIESDYLLTQRCLEECRDVANPVTLVTKSFLIKRDVELLAEMSRRAPVNVSFSIAHDDDAIARAVEPGAPRPAKRFEAMRILSDAGIRCGVLVAPLIPGLNESEIPTVLEKAKEAGAQYAHPIILRLPWSVKEIFLERMRVAFPDRVKRIESRIREARGGGLNDPRFGDRFKGKGEYWSAIESLFRVHAKRLGFEDEEKCARKNAIVRDGRLGEQLGLF